MVDATTMGAERNADEEVKRTSKLTGVPDEELYRRQVSIGLITCSAQGLHAIAWVFIQVTSLFLSLNRMSTGKATKPSVESQMWLTIALSTKQFVKFWSSEVVGRCTGWIGRKNMILTAFCLKFISLIFALIADLVGLPWLHVISLSGTGIIGETWPMTTAYISDVSMPNRQQQLVALVLASSNFFMVGGLIANIFLSKNLTVVYLVGLACSFASIVVCWFGTPDWSPPKCDRQTAPLSEKVKFAIGGPCFAAVTLLGQTSFTKSVLVLIGGGLITFYSFMGFMGNYIFTKYKVSLQFVTVFVMCFFCGNGICMSLASFLLKPRQVVVLAIAMSQVGILLMSMAGDNLVVFLIGVGSFCLAAPGTNALSQILMGQTIPEKKFQMVSCLKVTAGICAFCGSLWGGAWHGLWMKARKAGNDFIPSPVCMFVGQLVLTGGLLAAYYFRAQDAKLYENGATPRPNDEGPKTTEDGTRQ